MNHKVIIENSPNGSKKTVIVDGKLYPSMAQMRSDLRISETNIYNHKHMGYTTEESIVLCLQEKEAKEEQRRQKELVRKEEFERKKAYNEQFVFEFRGHRYSTFSQCCKHYSEKFDIYLNSESLKATAKRTGESRQDVLERCIQKRLNSKFKKRKPKELYVRFNSKEKANYCASALGIRYVDMFELGVLPVRYYVKYKPTKK